MRKLILAASFLLLFSMSCFALTAESRWAHFDGNKIHFLEAGDKKNNKDAIVFIHGWTCNADFWSDSINAFPNQRVIAVDLIGHGKSDKPQANYSMEYFARSVDAVLKEAKVKRAVLVGHSMGTPVARQVYRLYPDKVRGIVVVDGSLTPFFTKEQAEQLLASYRKDFKGTSTQFVNSMIQTIKSDAIKKKITDNMLTASEHVAISAMEGMMDARIWTDDKIGVPVLAIMAESPWVKPDTKDAFKAIAPNLDFQLWTGVSHFLMMERPGEFNGQIKAFMMKNKIL